MYQLQVAVNPKSCSRPRFSRKSGRAYHEPAYKTYRADLEAVLRSKWEGPPLEGPLVVTVLCYVKAPKKSKLPFPKPDVDNYVKGVMDAMNEIVFVDDWQVKRVECEKAWAPEGDPGRIHILIERA